MAPNERGAYSVAMVNYVLSAEQVDAYWQDGYLYLEDALTADQLDGLVRDFDGWVEESKTHTSDYGITLDERPRFDLQPGHSAERPALRRIASPIEVSDAYLEVMRNSRGLDAVTDLIGPNIEFNNSKVNAKHPGTATAVKYHQDFSFQPHSNEDLVAVLFFLDDVTPDNGPLKVVPGSHRGELFSHWEGGVFTGAVGSQVEKAHTPNAIPVHGPAGSACLMHTRLLHGSEPNSSNAPRTLFITEYRAEDSKPLDVNHIPSIYEGELVRGERTNRVRCSPFEMEFPEVPTGASFFSQQSDSERTAL